MSGLLVGIAQVDYTPRPALPLMGNFRDDYGARGVHDPLYARAVVFESPAGGRFAMLAVDICMMDRGNVAMMREAVASRCGLPPGSVLIAATHTHSGPAPMMLGSLPKSPDADIKEFLTRAATAVVAAAEDLRPANVLVGHGSEDRLSFNRRLRCRDGTTHMNWERLDPSFVVGPLGPIDPHIGTLRIDREGRPTACVVNFGLHPAILAGDNWLYSADYPGYLAEAMRRLHGPGFVTLFVNGPCGNVNHIDYRDPLQGRGYKMAERVGYMLAVGVFEAVAAGVPLKGDTVAVAREMVALQRLRISEVERRWCEEVIEKAERSGAPGQVDGVPDEYYARTRLRMYAEQETDDSVEVMAARVGELGIVGLPGEVFCELGMEVRRRSPAKHTLVIELANDAIGYIPTREAYAEGGYEATPGATMYQPGCGEALVESALRQLSQLFDV